jgi:tetratricopeptide (TPR) repeat protein
MADQNDDIPEELEVLAQLNRILGSAYFKNSKLQGNLLRLIVESSIAGTTLRELQIMSALYGKADTDSHKVRQNAKFVREKVARFYGQEGEFDAIKIELRPGQYCTEFFYNYDPEAIRLYREGLHHQATFSDHALLQSAACLRKGRTLAPTHLPTLLALTETALLLSLHYGLLQPASGWSRLMLTEVGKLLDELVSCGQGNSWRVQTFRGAAALLSHSWDAAHSSFAAALSANAGETRTSLWFALYLSTIGRIEEARGIVDFQLANAAQGVGIYLAAAALHYATRHYSRAEHLANRAWQLSHQDLDATFLILGLVWLGEKQPRMAYGLFERIAPHKVWLGDESSEHPRVDGLKYLSLKRWREANITKGIIGKRVKLGDIREYIDDGVLQEEARLERFQNGSLSISIQHVFNFMAQKRYARALGSLRRSWKAKEIWTLWWQVLPIFDELKEHPRLHDLMPAETTNKFYDSVKPTHKADAITVQVNGSAFDVILALSGL